MTIMSSNEAPPGRAQANELMASYARRVGVYDAELDAEGDVAFGEFGFHHHPDRDVLTGRVFVAKAWREGATPETEDAYRKVARALDDPQIGRMFEQGGGYFVLDETKRMYFLMKDFPLATTTPAELAEQMEELRDLGATWTVRWFGRVADIAHGRELPPVRPVTRQEG
jgi:hypothetical protein